MQIGPKAMPRDAGDLLDLDDVFGRDAIPLDDRSSSKAQAVSYLGEHSSFGADKGHSIGHKDRLPQGSGIGKRNCLPLVHVARGTIPTMKTGDRIRKARTDAKLSQRQLADRVGVSDGLVGQWETYLKEPGRDNLFKIAEVTLVDPSSLVKDLPPGQSGVKITDPRELTLLRRFRAASKRAQDNWLELMDMAGDVRRKIKQKRQPAETE